MRLIAINCLTALVSIPSSSQI